ncbi:SIR2 family protein [Cohaesibacter sp. ES.047]|uniref:SIR2 family protein n=1 Tax=Cohaesibacter sp. ES.047 TaxID=1798205 RepID=UPI000BB8DE89|nr:SIR2 family protein [Cohaesibacter sp. ES.047]
MSKLSPQERKALIEPLLRDASLNWGHVALASIIKQSNVKRVLSFNFDFLLEQAFSLLGEHLPVYDFGIAPASNISGLADKAVFHLHGQSYGLKLLNTEEETRNHAENLRPLIQDSLCNHVTIVAGYSGDADGVFQTMLEAYNGDSRLF